MTNKKVRWTFLALVLCMFLFIFVSHLSPKLALRAYLFKNGYFKSSLTTGIVDYEFEGSNDKNEFDKENATYYMLTKPAFDKDTASELANWKVKKPWIFYTVSFYNDI